jgi:hypothetical protein
LLGQRGRREFCSTLVHELLADQPILLMAPPSGRFASTSTGSTIPAGGIRPSTRSVRSSSSFVSGVPRSRLNQTVHEIGAISGRESSRRAPP